MSEQPLISVIVPVYKVEPYLDRCVQSIVNQTYENLEIILVDDGSPDNCPAMCDAWAAKDGRVQVIHKENGGVSTARNAGINIAKGAFFTFVDSDDWIAGDMILALYRLQKESTADVAGCCAEVVCDDHVPCRTCSDGNVRMYSFLEIVRNNFPNNSWSLWGKLYRSDLFDRVPRDLPSHLVMSEDIMLNTFLYKTVRKLRFLIVVTTIIFETEIVPFPENSSHRWCVIVRLLTLPCCHRSIQTTKFMAT